MSLTAAELEIKHGALLRQEPLSQCTSVRYLHNALTNKRIKVTEGAVKQWWKKYRGASADTSGAEIKSAKDLHEKYGAEVLALAQTNKTGYTLCKALRDREPPLFISDGIAKQFLKKYAGQEKLTHVSNAGHLETWHGERIRAGMPEGTTDGDALSAWLYKELSLQPMRRCVKSCSVRTIAPLVYCSHPLLWRRLSASACDSTSTDRASAPTTLQRSWQRYWQRVSRLSK